MDPEVRHSVETLLGQLEELAKYVDQGDAAAALEFPGRLGALAKWMGGVELSIEEVRASPFSYRAKVGKVQLDDASAGDVVEAIRRKFDPWS